MIGLDQAFVVSALYGVAITRPERFGGIAQASNESPLDALMAEQQRRFAAPSIPAHRFAHECHNCGAPFRLAEVECSYCRSERR